MLEVLERNNSYQLAYLLNLVNRRIRKWNHIPTEVTSSLQVGLIHNIYWDKYQTASFVQAYQPLFKVFFSWESAYKRGRVLHFNTHSIVTQDGEPPWMEIGLWSSTSVERVIANPYCIRHLMYHKIKNRGVNSRVNGKVRDPVPRKRSATCRSF